MSTYSSPGTINLPRDCIQARFYSREKRFLIRASRNGNEILAHTNNSGSMLGLLRPGRTVLLSPAQNPKRKLPYTLEMIRVEGFWVGVNTLVPNRMLHLAWQDQLIPELAGYEHFRSEAGTGKSRLDARLEGSRGRLWIEAKNVTLVEDDKAYFPDAVSKRAARHMEELIQLSRAGYNVACFYLVQRSDGKCFGPADFIDPEFAQVFSRALSEGLKVLAYSTRIDSSGIALEKRLPLHL